MLKDKLKLLRKSLDLTQGEIAEKLDVALTTYANWEQGTRHPDYDILIKLANMFDCTVDYLIGRTKDKNESLISPEKGQTLIVKAKNANVSLEELEAYIEARKNIQNIKD